MTSAIISSVDEDLWGEILKRLPIIDLLRFRCVCKSWNSLAASSWFITAQYLSSNSINSYLLFSYNPTCTRSYAFYCPQEFPHQPVFKPVPSDLFHVIDVIHGVVCLSRDTGLPEGAGNSTIIWNPTIHKFLEIPLPLSMRDVGFGFDALKNDFKVVRINRDWKQTKLITFESLSTREGQWRSVATDHIGPYSLETNTGCFKNGAIHWIIRRKWWVGLLVFDCEREEFKAMELPQQLLDQHHQIVNPMNLFMYFGKVSVLAATNTTMGMEEVVWVMEEYGVTSSWKKSTRYLEDFVLIEENGVFQPNPSLRCWVHINIINKVFERLHKHQPWNGHVFRPSMFLMDVGRSIV